MGYGIGAFTMKKIKVYVRRSGLLFLMIFSLHADQTQETFLKAGAYYEQGKITAALELYKKITVPYPSVFYNRGLCHYSLGHYSQALADFRNAQRLGNRELYNKVSHAVLLAQKKLGVSQNSSFFEMAMALHNRLPGEWLRLLFLLFLTLFSLLVLSGKIFARVRAGLLFCVVMTGIGCGYDYWFSHQRYGVVIPKVAGVYAGPDKQFHKVGEIQIGDQVKVVEEDHSWYKVYFPAGQGWVEQSDLGMF
jgi:tetratricopeptide (TPR) repeat protein